MCNIALVQGALQHAHHYLISYCKSTGTQWLKLHHCYTKQYLNPQEVDGNRVTQGSLLLPKVTLSNNSLHNDTDFP